MGRDRFDQLRPGDVVATLRSLERRFGAVVQRATREQLDDVIDRPGPSGERLADLVTEAARGAALVAKALDTALDSVEPIVAGAVLDPSERVFTDDRAWPLDTGTSALIAEAGQAADRIERATAAELSRGVAVTGAGSTTPLAIGQQLARELIEALTAADRHVEWLEQQL